MKQFTREGILDVELLQLEYFKVIAKTQNISAAAKELHVAQPSLSQLLKRLEQEAGVPLFDRVGKRIRLNAYGQVFLKYAEEVFSALENASLEIRTLEGKASKTVSLSILSASMLLPELYREIKAADPSLFIHVLQNNDHHAPEKNELIISSSWMRPDTETACRVLMEEEIRLALPGGHPLLKKEAVFLRDLEPYTFISLSPETSLSRILAHYFTETGYEPSVTGYIDNPDIMRKLLAAQAGLAFIPVRTWQGGIGGSIFLRRIEDLPMKRFIILSWNPDAFLTPSVLLCREKIIDYFTRYSLQCQ